MRGKEGLPRAQSSAGGLQQNHTSVNFQGKKKKLTILSRQKPSCTFGLFLREYDKNKSYIYGLVFEIINNNYISKGEKN